MKAALCRFCRAPLRHIFVDLGMSPLSNAYLKPAALQQAEAFYPLCVYLCGKCFLVQLEQFESPENIFSDYAYFSSYSSAWLKHAQDYVEAMASKFGLNRSSRVIEIASNDGYLLQFFKQKHIPILGIEPAVNVAKVARKKGIPTLTRFFGTKTARELARKGIKADLLLGNNVLAHVPNLNDFVAGLKIILKSAGVITMEFPHLMRLIAGNQFDTIYHEHFSYFSLLTVEKVFAHHGLTVFHVDELPTHGGSLRIYACHSGDKAHPLNHSVAALKSSEKQFGLHHLQIYSSFSEKVKNIKRELLSFLIKARQEGKSIAAYGAPAKGNTLLNYCGIRADFIDFTVDRSPHKQGYFLPGTHIPIYSPDKLKSAKPDYLLILPWNLKDEVIKQNAFVRKWGCRFVVPIPELQVMP